MGGGIIKTRKATWPKFKNDAYARPPIWLRPRVTLTFDLLIPKLSVSCPYHMDHLCQFASESVHCQNIAFTILVTGGRTDRCKTLWFLTVQSGEGVKIWEWSRSCPPAHVTCTQFGRFLSNFAKIVVTRCPI